MSKSSGTPRFHKGNPLKIAVLPGDGIGPLVMNAALPALTVLGIPHEKQEGRIGWECWRKEGDPVPAATWDLIRKTDTVLLGAITSKPLKEALRDLEPQLRDRNLTYTSPVIQLRQKLGLFANVRPVKDYFSGRNKFDFAVIRENTEGLYAGFDWPEIPGPIWDLVRKGALNFSDPKDASVALRIQSRQGLARLFQFAFSYAERNGIRLVTWADKPNVLRYSGNLAREVLEEVAAGYPAIEWQIQNADAVAMWMVRRPESLGLVVGENMFGDLLSDLGAGIMGGLGLAPSANIGLSGSYFEPVHGSAPKYANTEIPNPAAMFLTIAQMLRHYEFVAESKKLERAVAGVIQEGKFLTRDIGGRATTSEMAARILELCEKGKRSKNAAFIATGSELADGSSTNTASAHFARELAKAGFTPKTHLVVGDDRNEIKHGLAEALDRADLVVVSGGLGPTSDDNTREAISEVMSAPLQFSDNEWERIQARLARLGVAIHEDNRKQAFFPEGAAIAQNHNGTASGFVLTQGTKTVVVLPGPPGESFPLLASLLNDQRISGTESGESLTYSWRLLGVIEADIAAELEEILKQAFPGQTISPRYCWKYPYVDITLTLNKSESARLPLERIEALFQQNLVAREPVSATELLRLEIARNGQHLYLSDEASGGQIYRELCDPRTLPYLHLGEADTGLSVNVRGLGAFWSGSKEGRDSLEVTVRRPGHLAATLTIALPLRGDFIRLGAAEHVAFFLLKILKGKTCYVER